VRRTFLLLCGYALVLTPPARSDEAEPEPVRFLTADGVELRGSFSAGPKGRKSPAALLLHDLGDDRAEAAWDGLAAELRKAGLAVLRFDFRGHGRSTAVTEAFWQVPLNRQMVRGFHPSRPRESVGHDDFDRAYYPTLVNDVAAAKLLLDRKNDAGECNSSAVFLVGAGEGAAVGALWLAAESYRHRATGGVVPRLEPASAAKDVVAAVWLGLTPSLGRRRVPVAEAVRRAGRDLKVPTAFLHGESDEAASDFAARCVAALKGRADDMPLTAAQAVRDSRRDAGEPLRPSAEAGTLVRNYVENVIEAEGTGAWEPREVESNAYFWAFPGTRLLPAKAEGDRDFRLVPLPALGVR
jgi:pimeloyl-ACP methyl ester carboxylesterase